MIDKEKGEERKANNLTNLFLALEKLEEGKKTKNINQSVLKGKQQVDDSVLDYVRQYVGTKRSQSPDSQEEEDQDMDLTSDIQQELSGVT